MASDNSGTGKMLSDASRRSTTLDSIGLNPASEEMDLEGVSLLRRIFPDESIENLRKLHDERLSRAAASKRGNKESPNHGQHSSLSSELLCASSHGKIRGNLVHLPSDFLRLPLEKAVRRYNPRLHKWEYQLVENWHERALSKHQQTARCVVSADNFYTRVLERHPEDGLGITLTESMGFVRVFGQKSNSNDSEAIVNPGDIVVGINGLTLSEIILNGKNLLRETVEHLRCSPSPVCIHLQKMATKPYKNSLTSSSKISLLDTTLDESSESERSFDLNRSYAERSVHPLALSLTSRGLVKSLVDQSYITSTLQQFAERVHQWELSNSFYIHGENHQLLSSLGGVEDHLSAYTTPTQSRSQPAACLIQGSANDVDFTRGYQFPNAFPLSSYPGSRARTSNRPHELSSHIFIPLMGVRQALSVRILHSFLDSSCHDTRAIYTIWVCDIESAREWYAPARYLKDFEDLRASLVNLRPDIAGIPFPRQGWFSFGSNEASESEAARETKCQQLENFLRTLCAMIFTHTLHPATAEVAIHVQSFLGCDNIGPWELAAQAAYPVKCIYDGVEHTEEQFLSRRLLTRKLQMYIYRIFLLGPMAKLVSQFVEDSRTNGPSLKEIEKMQAKSRHALKKRANSELERIQVVVNQLQNMILEGCSDDIRVISQGETFDCLRESIFGENWEVYLDRLAREAIRSQVEIEVYVPLRGTVSRLLVNAWRHEDMAVSFKVQVSFVL